ncbi:hypothetical protein E2651_39720 [Streptomyces sp. MZ04]|nr:hypothetical protein E2651_39720 [Streptomyces sp. MZ04]
MIRPLKAVVLIAATTALIAPTAAQASPDGARGNHKNVRLEKVAAKDKAACFTMSGKTGKGATLRQAKCSKNSTQRWDIEGVLIGKPSDSYYLIINRKSGKCLHSGSKKSGSAITQQKCYAGNDKELWNLNNMRITNFWSKKSILSPNNKSGTKLKLGKKGGSVKDERWGLS